MALFVRSELASQSQPLRTTIYYIDQIKCDYTFDLATTIAAATDTDRTLSCVHSFRTFYRTSKQCNRRERTFVEYKQLP